MNAEKLYYLRRLRTADEMEAKQCCKNCALSDIALIPIEARRYAQSGKAAWCDKSGRLLYKFSDHLNLMCVQNGLPTGLNDVCPSFEMDRERWICHKEGGGGRFEDLKI